MRVPGIRYVQGRNSYVDRDSLKYGIAIHNTSNTASDEGETSYATWRTDGTSAHLYADHDSVTQSLDTDAVAGHSGSYAGNEHAIAVEITGANGKSREWWLTNVAWDKLGAALAAVIREHWPNGSFQLRRASVAEMRANPKVRAFYGHDDMRRAWGGTTHTDPGPNFPWDRLISAVRTALEGDDMPTADEIANAVWKRPVASAWLGIKDRPAADWIKFADAGRRDLAVARSEAKARHEAMMAALLGSGDRVDAVMRRIEELAAAEAARDAALAALVAQGLSGQLDAREVVRQIGELLTADQSGG